MNSSHQAVRFPTNLFALLGILVPGSFRVFRRPIIHTGSLRTGCMLGALVIAVGWA
jgi:hypothetical protein